MEQNNTVSNMMNLLNLDNKSFSCYCFWCSVLVIKMMLMSLLTALQRFRNKTVPNREDCTLGKDLEVQFNNPAVERVRRAHRNDMENILPQLITGLVYLSTNPTEAVACNLFRVSAIARILHTLVYAFRPVPQPSRAIAFFVAYGCTMYMALMVALRTLASI